MRYLAVLLGLLLLTACSKVNQENLGKIKTGMSQDEIEQILGSADMCTETLGTKTCSWGNDNKSITASFVADSMLVVSNKGL